MTTYYTVTSHGDGPANQYAKYDAGHVFLQRLRQPGVIAEPSVTEFAWGAPNTPPDWPLTLTRLFSERMAEIVDAYLSPLDKVQWLPAVVVGADGYRADYRIPHFTERPDVLDRDASTWGPSGQPIRWVLDLARTAGRTFFPSHAYGSNVIVDDTMLAAFRAAELTGLDVDRARIADQV
ncbi:hypothetical protein [Cellulomonas sp. URHB0016]